MTEPDIEREVVSARASIDRVRGALAERFLGHEGVVDELLLVILSGGHALIEGVPGVGKTTLVRSLAAALDAKFGRVQFTPDLMPGDILGTRVLEERDGERRFVFHLGPIFANVVLADEINRATPRTQSALLEAMQEHSVTAFGETRSLPEPFFVIAPENPIEMEGTYPLPEAQLDRFLFKIRIETPNVDELVAILESSAGPVGPAASPVLQRPELVRAQQLVREIPAASDIVREIAQRVLLSHPTTPGCPDSVRSNVRHGASPRGGQAMLLAARAHAFMNGRLHVSTADVRRVARPALRHRLLLNYEAEATGVNPDEIVDELMQLPV